MRRLPAGHPFQHRGRDPGTGTGQPFFSADPNGRNLTLHHDGPDPVGCFYVIRRLFDPAQATSCSAAFILRGAGKGWRIYSLQRGPMSALDGLPLRHGTRRPQSRHRIHSGGRRPGRFRARSTMRACWQVDRHCSEPPAVTLCQAASREYSLISPSTRVRRITGPLTTAGSAVSARGGRSSRLR